MAVCVDIAANQISEDTHDETMVITRIVYVLVLYTL